MSYSQGERRDPPDDVREAHCGCIPLRDGSGNWGCLLFFCSQSGNCGSYCSPTSSSSLSPIFQAWPLFTHRNGTMTPPHGGRSTVVGGTCLWSRLHTEYGIRTSTVCWFGDRKAERSLTQGG